MALISESGMEFSASLDLRDTLMATAQRLRAAVDVPDCEILLTHGTDELHCLLSLLGDEVCHDWDDRVAPPGGMALQQGLHGGAPAGHVLVS